MAKKARKQPPTQQKKHKEQERSDHSIMWSSIGQERKANNEAKQSWSLELLQDFTKKYDIRLRALQPWHFRLSKGLRVIDIYPPRQRCVVLNSP